MADQIDALIKLRRGPDSERRNITFESGEAGYSTDVKRIFIGDGTTMGGSLIGNQNTIGSLPNPSAIKYDFFFDNTSNIMYLLSSEAGPDNILNYARVSPIADEDTLIYRDGKFSLNPAYMNDSNNGFVRLSGSIMSGFLTLVGAPVLPFHATPKFWVEEGLSALSGSIINYINTGGGGGGGGGGTTNLGGFLPLSGGTMKAGTITLVNEPTLSAHVVNLGYLQNKYLEDPTIKTDGQILKYSQPANAWVAGYLTNDYIDTNIRTVTTNTTLDPTDSNNIVMFNSTNTLSCFLPSDTAGHRLGTQIIVIQKGTGRIVFTGGGIAGGGTVAVRSNSNRRRTISQWSGAVCIKIASNEWFVGGDVTV